MSVFSGFLIIINLLFLIWIWWYSVKHYKMLTTKIPMHFDFEGKPDGYGNKKWFWMLPMVALAIFIGLNLANLYPETGNYVVEITEKNKDFQYGIVGVFTQFMVFVILGLCFCIQENIVKLQTDEKAMSRIPYWVFIILMFFMTMAFIIISATVK